MSINDMNNSPKIYNGINTIKNISNEFELSNNNNTSDIDELIVTFFKNFSIHISANKNSSLKIKFAPQLYDAKNDFNIAKIYEKDGKLLIKSNNYENEFDKYYTQVNKIKEQKRKTKQNLKNGYEIPLYKTIYLNDLNNKLYEDTILNSEIKYDVFNSIFFPQNDRCLNKDSDLIFNLNQKMVNKKNGILLFDDNKYMNLGEEKINKKEKNENESNINQDIDYLLQQENKKDININNNINNINCFNNKNNKKSIYFKNTEIMLEITKYNNYIQENISLFLLNLSNNQNSEDNLQNNNNNKLIINIEKMNSVDKLNNLNDIIKTTDNTHILDLINHFNNIFTPQIYNKFSFYKNIIINNPSQTLNEMNSVLDQNESNILDKQEQEDNLMNDIKKYFEEELVKEINKDLEITQSFTHFYIEGNILSKDNMRKIISFLSKDNFYMFCWSFNKEETKKYGLINNIVKVATISNKIWFYINIKKNENNNNQ